MTDISIVCAIVITFISNWPITHEQCERITGTGRAEEVSAHTLALACRLQNCVYSEIHITLIDATMQTKQYIYAGYNV